MTILYIVLGLIALILIAGLVIPKDINATKEINIHKPVDEVFHYIKYVKNQNHYSKWAGLDPQMKTDYRGTDGTVGFVSHWSGNKKVGEGEQEITAIDEGKALYTDLRFIKPFKSFAKVMLTTEPNDAGGTKVTWRFTSKMNYPMNVMMLFMNMSEMVGRDFSTGLQNLKRILEA